MTSSADSEAIPLPQKESPIQYPKLAFLFSMCIFLRPIIPTKPPYSGFLLYSIAKFKALVT